MRSSRLVIVAIAGFVAGGDAALAQEFVPQNYFATCGTDLFQFCSDLDPAVGGFVQCLQKNAAEITAQCRVLVTPNDGPEGTASIEVTVVGVNSDQGNLLIMLTDDPKKFPTGRRLIMPRAKVGTTVGTFKHLKPGTYAVTTFHDANGNNVFDRAATPIEGFISINTTSDPASFANSSMKVTGETKLTLTLKYY